MNIEIEQKEELLPIIDLDVEQDDFFDLDKDVSEAKIKKLVGKQIIYNLKNDSGITLYISKLVEWNSKHLKVKENDEEEDNESNVDIDSIVGIEEFRIINPGLKFKKEFENQLCEITNQHDQKIIVLIKYYDGIEISFDIKYKKNNIVYLSEYFYPLTMLKNIDIVNEHI